MKIIRKIINVIVSLISVCVIVVALMLLITVVFTSGDNIPNVAGYSMFRVLTGSMEPEIKEGAVIVTKSVPYADIHIGDVISFFSEDPMLHGSVNTHRVISIENEDGVTMFFTKGDANNVADNYPVKEEDYIGKVVYTNKWVGSVVALTSNPLVFVPLIAIPLLYFMISNIMKTVRMAKQIAVEEEAALLRELEEKKTGEEDKAEE